MQNPLPQRRKRNLGQGLLDLALLLAVLRQSEVAYLTAEDDGVQDLILDDGPVLGITSVHHFQEMSWLESPGYSQKSANLYYDNIIDEYENIMRDIRSRPPAMYVSSATVENGDENEMAAPEGQPSEEDSRSIVTMVLGLSNVNDPSGGVQLATRSNFSQEGAVGGLTTESLFSNDENFDLFNTFSPSHMADDEIDNLMFTSLQGNESSSSNNSYLDNSSDVRWQQYISGYNSSMYGHQGSLAMCCRTTDGAFAWGGGSDILNEALLSSEIFLNPVNTEQSGNNDPEPSSWVVDVNLNPGPNLDTGEDVLASARLEALDLNRWDSQNHEDDLLFPSLPPPSYEEVTANSTSDVVAQPQRYTNAMHDHNYFNNSVDNRMPSTGSRRPQNRGYAIRSRHEISTRVITVPPRPRHISDVSSTASEPEVTDAGNSDTASSISAQDITDSHTMNTFENRLQNDVQSQEHQQISMDGEVSSYIQGDFEIEPASSVYYQNLAKDVRIRREVILCN